jgi:hypothetical protein
MKIEGELAGLPSGDPSRTGEIKEKWLNEDGSEHTLLHTDVPEAVHDAVLALSALQAAAIYRKQEILIQMVNDADTAEAAQGVTW